MPGQDLTSTLVLPNHAQNLFQFFQNLNLFPSTPYHSSLAVWNIHEFNKKIGSTGNILDKQATSLEHCPPFALK
jgi:hypothetical protein